MSAINEWVESPEHPGYLEKVIKKGSVTIQILRPKLSEQERTQREKHLKKVAETTLRDYYYRKERTS